jgi:hypothetical protein
MKQNKKPDTGVFLPREIFNSLVSALTFFEKAELEKHLGHDFFSKHSTRLKRKILKHGRAFRKEGGDFVANYFYGIEAALLIKLLAYYISMGFEPTGDYFNELQ